MATNTEAQITGPGKQVVQAPPEGHARVPEDKAQEKSVKRPQEKVKTAYEFSDLDLNPKSKAPADMDFILDVPLEISVELGNTRMQIHELLKLSQGSVIELTKNAGESLEILANRRLIARGEVVVANEKYGIRVTEIISPMERVAKLK